MNPTDTRKLGKTGIPVTAMGFGAAPLANHTRFVEEDESRSVIQGAWDAGIRYFDTAPLYGHGLSELRLGEALRWRPRDAYVLSTKVGRLLKPSLRQDLRADPKWVAPSPFNIVNDYSYDAMMRSFEDSLHRLALERIDILFIHDIDNFSYPPDAQKAHFRTAMDSGFKALDKLRSEGLVSAIGVGCNEWEVCEAAVRERDFDVVLLAGRYTLLEQDALISFLPLCEKRNVAVVLGGGFNSGILATGAVSGAYYNYSEAPELIVARVRELEGVCRDFDVPLGAAALQFVLAHPAIPTNIPGTRTTKHLADNIALLGYPIPNEFWVELKRKRLLDEAAPTP